MSKTPLSIIDSHCHLDFAAFDADRSTVLNNCFELGVSDLILPGVTADSWASLAQLVTKQSSEATEKHSPKLHYALGMHPVFLNEHKREHLAKLDELLHTEPVIAVGEIGLDFYIKELAQTKQTELFSDQLILAKNHDLPVILHVRKAHDQTIKLLKKHQVKGGIVHAFNGSIQQAHHYIELGFKLGFGGMLTYERSSRLKQLAQTLPLESIVLETDSPDMVVAQHQSERNSPEYLPLVLEALSDIRNESIEDIANITKQNTLDVFSLPTVLTKSH